MKAKNILYVIIAAALNSSTCNATLGDYHHPDDPDPINNPQALFDVLRPAYTAFKSTHVGYMMVMCIKNCGHTLCCAKYCMKPQKQK